MYVNTQCIMYVETESSSNFILNKKQRQKKSSNPIKTMPSGSTAMFANLGSFLASLMFIEAMVRRFMPQRLSRFLDKHFHSLVRFFYPYIQIKFNEYTGERLTRSEVYTPIKHYLSSNTSIQATRLQADTVHRKFVLSMDDNEEVTDEFSGVKFRWTSRRYTNTARVQAFYAQPAADQEKRYYQLAFHKKHRDLVIGEYLNHVVKEGKLIMARNRQRKLYTNNGPTWNHVVFRHPARFETLGMEPEKKQEIIDDLITFSKSKEFYAEIGRAWKRGYLLYGPPGTGKSTMIAAMANLLGYDLYDLELTAVKDNTELKKLLIDTSSKSIILIEDIDCSIDLTGQRKKGKGEEPEEERVSVNKGKGERDGKTSMVTLSGLLNFIDGLWSSCKGERLIVFTTNHVEKLDPALVRSGRMDKHIELSYCCFHSFKVLAKNYLKLESHELFSTIGRLLEETEMAPADVAEHLMPKTFPPDAQVCLQSLISALEMSKEKESMKSKEEEENPTEEPVDQTKQSKMT